MPVDGGEPVILDVTTSTVAEGKLMVAMNKGEHVPEGWIIDRDASGYGSRSVSAERMSSAHDCALTANPLGRRNVHSLPAARSNCSTSPQTPPSAAFSDDR